MSYKISTIKSFERDFKHLMKKYKSLQNDMHNLGEVLKQQPIQGTSIGNNCYKIRMKIAQQIQGQKWWSKSYYLCVCEP